MYIEYSHSYENGNYYLQRTKMICPLSGFETNSETCISSCDKLNGDAGGDCALKRDEIAIAQMHKRWEEEKRERLIRKHNNIINTAENANTIDFDIFSDQIYSLNEQIFDNKQ